MIPDSETIRFLSVCSGIECASLAFAQFNWTPVGVAEIDPFACALLAHRFGCNLPGEPLPKNGVPNHGDFTTIDVASLPPVDVLVGGTPCQGFSITGKRLSLADARGNLTLAFAVLAHELVRLHRLKNLIWENVVGCLNTEDNAFGCLLAGLIGASDPVLPSDMPAGRRGNINWRWREKVGRLVPCWPDTGMVAGPRGRAAWTIKDAQYFGLAQRRERVFLVADFGYGADPVEVLFERASLRGNPTPSRRAGESVAYPLAASSGKRGGVPQADATESLIPEVARCVTAREGQRLDESIETLIPIAAHTLRGEGFDASEDGTGRGTPIIPIAFDSTNITHPENRPNPQPGDPVHSLAAGAHPPAIAFQERFRGDDGRGYDRAPPALIEQTGALETVKPWNVATEEPFTIEVRGREEGRNLEYRQDGLANALRSADGGRDGLGIGAVATRWAVRRLTPRECERLQGVPDHWTKIPWAGKHEDQCPDGHRYRSLGNGWAVPCIAWIGKRLNEALRCLTA